MDERNSEGIQLSFPARLEFLDLVDNVIAAVNELMEFGEDEATAVSISVIEAGTNAIQHGCHNGNLTVHMTFFVEKDQLAVEVSDPGEGFDPDSLPDPTSPDNLLKERGRGIFIMRQMMDELDFEFAGGTKLRMVKKRPSSSMWVIQAFVIGSIVVGMLFIFLAQRERGNTSARKRRFRPQWREDTAAASRRRRRRIRFRR